MSITRLQQARQMYAMGQRVGRIAFGGGGSYSSQGGYQGQGGAATGGATGSNAGGEGTGTDGQGGTGGPNPEDNHPFNTGPVQTVTPMDVKEQYNLGVTSPPVGTPQYNQPDFTKVGPGSTQYNNYIDKLNLKGATYNPPDIPFFVPGSTLIKTLGSFGFNKNKDFSEKNVAGKYGYGYGLKDFEKYMGDRTSGKVGAYGNENMGQDAINARAAQGDSTQGVMNIDVSDMTDDTTDDTTTDDFVSRFLQNQPDDIREAIEARMQNYYTDRKSTRLNSSHGYISYAVFCLKKKKKTTKNKKNKKKNKNKHYMPPQKLLITTYAPIT